MTKKQSMSSRPSRIEAETPFQSRSRTARQIANELFGFVGVVHFPGLPQDALRRGAHGFWQALQNVARLVNLAALDRRIASEGPPDRLGQCFRAVDDEEARRAGIEPMLDEIVDERLHGRRLFRRALDEAERVFVAVRVDVVRRDEDHVLVHVNAVDLDRQCRRAKEQ